ncbi:nitroreductase family protein [Gudongella sp. SC589]|uniref:nitroreductase family protein n=1 Tax=Gudongella sp. SC589 TaxID=3385990 RepID=UPI003904DA0F
MSKNYYEVMKIRRSMYALTRETTIEKERIKEVVEHSLNYTPSAFNSQSGRVVVLFGDDHDKFWEITKNSLISSQPEDRHNDTAQKIDNFKHSFGTALFFEDYDVVEGLQNQFPKAKDNFPLWSYQSSGMLQYNVWTSLAAEGLGASLQHYNEAVEEEVKKHYNLPSKWKLMAQMPFGKPAQEPGEKEIIKAEDKMKVFGLN